MNDNKLYLGFSIAPSTFFRIVFFSAVAIALIFIGVILAIVGSV